MKQLTILGSTGSIGTSTLSVVRDNPEHYRIFALVAGFNVDIMAQQCLEFKPSYACMADETSANALKTQLVANNVKTEVVFGQTWSCRLAAAEDVTQVMSAIVGAQGLLPTLAAVKAGKEVLLANKESLVTSGHLFMDAVKQYGATLLPIDSEHNAIFQCLPVGVQTNLGHAKLADYGIANIILTGSGGPFRETPLDQLSSMSPQQACAHPNWSMGRKVSVDSATMMNKGLEYIEARNLFNASAAEMEIIIHPQSVIHSMVRYCDGSVIAQLGTPDMRTPIAHAMAYPHRTQSGVAPLDFTKTKALTFNEPDFNRYPCLKLAIEASAAGQAATTTINAANEIAVEAFLFGRIKFTTIAQINAAILEKLNHSEPNSIEEVLAIDKWARESARRYLAR